jgi:hypothetical protein
MNFKTHISFKQIMRFEKLQNLEWQCRVDVLCAFWLQTDGEESSGRWMMCLNSIDVASNARNLDSPLMELTCAVTIQSFFPSKLHKQLMRMMKGDCSKRKFEDWSRNEKVLANFVQCVLEEFERIPRVWDLILGLWIFLLWLDCD